MKGKAEFFFFSRKLKDVSFSILRKQMRIEIMLFYNVVPEHAYKYFLAKFVHILSKYMCKNMKLKIKVI